MIKWKEINPEVGPVYHRGFLGKIHVFSIQYSMTNNNEYVVSTGLPFINTKDLSTSSIEVCKSLCKGALNNWLDLAGLRKE